jgi:hypothetical protein
MNEGMNEGMNERIYIYNKRRRKSESEFRFIDLS